MIKNQKAIKILTIILAVAIFANLAFIFSNSVKSMEQSAEQSGGIYVEVKPVIDPVIKPVVGSSGLTHHLFRKMAHFAEFFALGFFVSALLFVRDIKNLKIASSCYFAGFLVAGIDETLQIFTSRGSAFFDVLIDFFGYSTAFFAVVAIWLVANKFMKKG